MSQNTTKNKKLFHISMKAKERTSERQFSALTKLKKELDLSEKKLHTAVVTNNTEAIANLLVCGVNPNATDNLLRSPLHLSASRGYKEVVSLLIKYGADPNQKDIIGNTALHLAACTNNIEIVTLLLDAGTDVSSLDQFGRNPLQLAQSKLRLIQKTCKTGPVELVQLRLQIQQVIDLMLSFLRRQETSVEELQIMKLKLDKSTDAQLDDQLSLLLNAIQGISIK